MSLNRAVLITGASGFIGGYTAKHFSQSGWQVIALDRKESGTTNHPAEPFFNHYVQDGLTNLETSIACLKRHQPQVCIHLAGPASVNSSFKEPLADFSNQTIPLFHILEAVRLSEVPTRVLLISSAAVYGNPESLPVAETARINPISPYGYHKYYQEMLLDQYHVLYGLGVSKARVFSTYGSGLTHLAVWDITKRALSGDRSLEGTGEESRDYLHVSDVARALLCIAEQSPFAGEAINVASGTETKITDLAETIYQALGVGGKPELIGGQAGRNNRNPKRWHADTARLRSLGFDPRVDLEAGLSSTVKWIKQYE